MTGLPCESVWVSAPLKRSGTVSCSPAASGRARVTVNLAVSFGSASVASWSAVAAGPSVTLVGSSSPNTLIGMAKRPVLPIRAAFGAVV